MASLEERRALLWDNARREWTAKLPTAQEMCFFLRDVNAVTDDAHEDTVERLQEIMERADDEQSSLYREIHGQWQYLCVVTDRYSDEQIETCTDIKEFIEFSQEIRRINMRKWRLLLDLYHYLDDYIMRDEHFDFDSEKYEEYDY